MRQRDDEISVINPNDRADYCTNLEEAQPNLERQALGMARMLLNRILNILGNPPIRLVLWDGREVVNEAGSGLLSVRIQDAGALLRLVANPELSFGEMYAAGRVEVMGDLVSFLETVYRNLPSTRPRSRRQKLLAQLALTSRNTLSRGARNVYHHYDIGNDFYKLWLDEHMVYTCAYFPDREMSLEAAQVAKLDYICRKLRLLPGERVVEAGCGWGALALHMARHYGVSVAAYNLSREQLAYAREKARALGLDGQVEFVERDYREIDGHFDVFVSVGMLEHVGIQHFRELGAVMDRCLRKSGRGLIHSIGRDYPQAMNAWIERYIFPGACPPSLSQMTDIFEPFGFSILDIENLRLHYARTLEHWRHRYESVADRVRDMFDPDFVRMWRLYLAGSLAAFRSGDMQLFQILFARGGCNRIPWSRHDLYEPR